VKASESLLSLIVSQTHVSHCRREPYYQWIPRRKLDLNCIRVEALPAVGSCLSRHDRDMQGMFQISHLVLFKPTLELELRTNPD